jgi:aspartyl protease family protein
MIVKQIAVLAVATLSALVASAGVIALAHARTETPAAAPVIARAADGHFWADATVTGANGRGAVIHFLVDTGASSVALTARDAARLGIDPALLRFNRPVFTAEGRSEAAPVVLPRVEVAGAAIQGVKALVLRGDGQSSLLGMSYLGRLSRIEATPSQMILRR